MKAHECIESHTPCMEHRYHIVHTIKGCNQVFSHSQNQWDANLRQVEPDKLETWPSYKYEHGMTADELRVACQE